MILDLVLKDCSDFYISKDSKHLVAVQQNQKQHYFYCYYYKDCGCQVSSSTELKEVDSIHQLNYKDLEEISPKEFREKWIKCKEELECNK